jgi:hypothetical protein
VYYYRKHTFVFAASQLRFSRSASFGTDFESMIFMSIFTTGQLGCRLSKRHCMVWQSQKKATTFEIPDFDFRRRRPAAFSSRFQKKCPIANGGGRSSLRATVLWGASLHSLTSSHLHALGEYRPHAIRVLTCRLTCADLSSRAFSNYPL